MSPGGRPLQTTPEQWASAALDEIEGAGVRALSVQSVARALGVSKGGVYHHFADRRALLCAALDLWAQRHVIALEARFEAIDDPRERLHRVLVYAAIEMQPTIILQLMAAAEDPDVAAILRHSSEARIALLRRLFVQLGATPRLADDRAIITYSYYLGLVQLRAHTDVLADPERLRRHVEALEQGLLADL